MVLTKSVKISNEGKKWFLTRMKTDETQKNVIVNFRDKEGNTALMLAVERCGSEVVSLYSCKGVLILKSRTMKETRHSSLCLVGEKKFQPLKKC